MKRSLKLAILIAILCSCESDTDNAEPVILSEKNNLTSFVILGDSASIDNEARTVSLTLDNGINLSALTPSITVSEQAEVSPNSGIVQNFNSPVEYSVHAENKEIKTYTASISTNKIISFEILGVAAVIDEVEKTILVTLPSGTDDSSLTATILIPPNTIVSPASGTAQNFSDSVLYILNSNKGNSVDYTAKVYIPPCAEEINIDSLVYNGKLYEIVKQNKTWIKAAECAVSRGGYLAEINNSLEQDALYTWLKDVTWKNLTIAPDGGNASYVWLGASDRESEIEWIWDGNADGVGPTFWRGFTAGVVVDSLYNNWGNEPDNFGNQDALGLSLSAWPFGTSGQWNDLDEDNSLYFIIEYDI